MQNKCRVCFLYVQLECDLYTEVNHLQTGQEYSNSNSYVCHTVVSQVSAHGHLNITHDFGPYGRLPGIYLPFICIEAATLTLWNVVPGADPEGGFLGLQPPPPKWSQSHLYYILAWCAGALIYIAKSMAVSLVCSEQVVKPHSSQIVVKPKVLHLSECLLLQCNTMLLKAIETGVVFIKWAWFQIFVRALRALFLQPHHSKIPRSAPGYMGAYPGVGICPGHYGNNYYIIIVGNFHIVQNLLLQNFI
jgi:hypothetical protein